MTEQSILSQIKRDTLYTDIGNRWVSATSLDDYTTALVDAAITIAVQMLIEGETPTTETITYHLNK